MAVQKIMHGGTFCSQGGARNFDNILYAWLAIFQTITMTDWVFIMYDTQVGFFSFLWFYVPELRQTVVLVFAHGAQLACMRPHRACS